jgi:uncharacterized protein (DUF2267 family)
MSESELLTYVQRAAALDSEAEAERLAEAALAELGESISRGEADDLAERLPTQFGRALLEGTGRAAAPEDLETFLENIAEEADIEENVRAKVRGVFAAVTEYAGAEEVENAAAQLPPEYGAVVEPGSVPVAETFVDAVQAETPLGGEAPEAAEATLETLSERLTEGEGEDIAAYLQGDAENWVVDHENPEAEAFSTDEFVRRVAERTEVTEDLAEEYVIDVTNTLGDVVPDRELDQAIAQLPDEYGALFAFEKR